MPKETIPKKRRCKICHGEMSLCSNHLCQECIDKVGLETYRLIRLNSELKTNKQVIEAFCKVIELLWKRSD